MRFISSILLITILPSLIFSIDLSCKKSTNKFPIIGSISYCSVISASFNPSDVANNVEVNFNSVNLAGISFDNLQVTQIPRFSQNVSAIMKLLVIKSCGLTSINQKDLINLPNLKILDVSFNSIAKLEPNLFKFNPNLVIIDLADNEISLIEENAFEGLNKLQYLNLTFNFCTSSRRADREGVKRLINYLNVSCGEEYKNYTKAIANYTKLAKDLKINKPADTSNKMPVYTIINIACAVFIATCLLCCCCCFCCCRRTSHEKPEEHHPQEGNDKIVESPQVIVELPYESNYMTLSDCKSEKNLVVTYTDSTDNRVLPNQHPGINLATLNQGSNHEYLGINHPNKRAVSNPSMGSNLSNQHPGIHLAVANQLSPKDERATSFQVEPYKVSTLRKPTSHKESKQIPKKPAPSIPSASSEELRKNQSSLSKIITQMNARENNLTDLPDDENEFKSSENIYNDVEAEDAHGFMKLKTKRQDVRSSLGVDNTYVEVEDFEQIYDVVARENEYDVLPATKVVEGIYDSGYMKMRSSSLEQADYEEVGFSQPQKNFKPVFYENMKLRETEEADYEAIKIPKEEDEVHYAEVEVAPPARQENSYMAMDAFKTKYANVKQS